MPVPRFVIGLVLPLQLTTPTTYFSLDRKCRSRKRNQIAVFIMIVKFFASDYDSDSDSVVIENQPL